ncbi:hypothetical protein [Flavobacterium sp. DSP2-3-1]|uniref:hypothetical protein n=1 Tax=unclassified Flavobacterium TaxID=196869 RepID=UPI003CF03495
MDKQIKILIISSTPWDDNNSFGSSFSNIFGGNPNYEIANIYCLFGLPNTKVAKHFFQITEKGIVRTLLGKQKFSGKQIFTSVNENFPDTMLSNSEMKFVNKLKILRWQIFFWIRDLVWSTGKWKSKPLDDFITNFQPDLIFLPIYYSTYMNTIGLYAQMKAGVKMVGYISDDCYTLKHFSLSPLFWIDRFIKRAYVKKAIDQCEILYTITETQKNEYNAIFGNKCKVLFKGGDFDDFSHQKKILNHPIKIIYTGNLGMGRWKSLAKIGEALQLINCDGLIAQLYIYSQTHLSASAMEKLKLIDAICFMGGIPSTKVKDVQRDSDILVHVESFKLSERNSARLSFSTKIVDYLEAGRCIVAVGWEKTGAIEYLMENDVAIVITDVNQIYNQLNNLIGNKQLIFDYAIRGFELGKKNHQFEKIRNGLYNDLVFVATSNNM